MKYKECVDYKALYLELVAKLETEQKRDEELQRETDKNFKEFGEALKTGTLSSWLERPRK